MNIQDLSYQDAQKLIKISNGVAINIGYYKKEYPSYQVGSPKSHPEDARFILPDISPLHRKLVLKFENEEVLVGIFIIPELKNEPYPLSAQYSLYIVDKKNPSRGCGGGICPSEFCYPPVNKRDRGIDRKDVIKLVSLINDGLKNKEFKTRFDLTENELNSYHTYWPRPEFDVPFPGKVGDEHRAEDGILRRLEYLFEEDNIRVEVTAHVERYTEFTKGCGYSVDFFKDGKCFRGVHVFSNLIWPSLLERKFGIDYYDWMKIQEIIKINLDDLKIKTGFEVKNDEEKYCYGSSDKTNQDLILIKKKFIDQIKNPEL